MLILSYENEFNLHVNENSFSYERMSTKTRFEKEAEGNSEMAYLTKTEFLLIGSKQKLLKFTAKHTATINKVPIKQVSTVKSLGVYIDENLTWECHVNELLGIRFHIRLYLPSTIH